MSYNRNKENTILTINNANAIFGLYLFIGLMAILLIASIGYSFGVKDTEKKLYSDEISFTMDGNTKVFCPTTMEEYDIMADYIESNSTGKTIEISMGTVMDSEGNGVSDYGYYIHYDKEVFKEGDRILSVFTYRNGLDAEDRYNILVK